MSGPVLFALGMMAGCTVGVMLMACLIIGAEADRVAAAQRDNHGAP